ncbi:putative NBD/HSP70 family sugar kinase [Micromonospora pisi]|uniref:Putative NBD/HSP70 family sugar kinase n=1 Tax=Micromonospora pisi TaxID=589240 RepID=A0A495J9W7_9ACTN|nr:ROK family protein [Micromonospora pisi]RKR85820.1 putative NBD/HSP70 family sugar kinase [Micromonospora pisi]
MSTAPRSGPLHPASAPGDQLSLRRANLSRTLGHLRAHGPRSRAAIAAGTGLHKATVSSLVDELLARQLVQETGLEYSGTAGRPGRAVALDGAGVGALGVAINVDYIGVHATDLAGRVLVERRIAFDATAGGPDRCVAALTEVILEALRDLERRGAVPVGVTVAVPGLVDVAHGAVVLAPNLDWHDLPLGPRLVAALPAGLRVVVDNDANLAALAEHTYGVAAGTRDLVYLTGEVGVGGGVISDGRLLRGTDGFSGEVGHLPVDPAGRRCGCGRTGCWETKVGLAELVRAVTPDRAYGLESGPLRVPEERVAELHRRLAAGDPVALDAVAEVGRWLGLGGAILVNLVNPRVLVLGGYFATLAEWLIPAARPELDRLAVAGRAAHCRFVASDLGFTAAARGAAGVVVDRVIADPTSVGSPPDTVTRVTAVRVP